MQGSCLLWTTYRGVLPQIFFFFKVYVAFSLACANLVCSIKEFIPWLGKKETENQKDLVQMSYISECSPQKCFSSPWKYLLVVWVCSSNTYFAYDPQFLDLSQGAQIPVKSTCKHEKIYYSHESISCCSEFFWKKKFSMEYLNCAFGCSSTISISIADTFSPILSASWVVSC